jgi:hypothetical protein
MNVGVIEQCQRPHIYAEHDLNQSILAPTFWVYEKESFPTLSLVGITFT